MSYLSTDGSFDLTRFETEGSFDLTRFESDDSTLFPVHLENFQIVEKGTLPPYEGEYIAHPTFNDQIFETKNKRMRDDFEVTPIRVSRVSNPFGGITVYIGD